MMGSQVSDVRELNARIGIFLKETCPQARRNHFYIGGTKSS